MTMEKRSRRSDKRQISSCDKHSDSDEEDQKARVQLRREEENFSNSIRINDQH